MPKFSALGALDHTTILLTDQVICLQTATPIGKRITLGEFVTAINTVPDGAAAVINPSGNNVGAVSSGVLIVIGDGGNAIGTTSGNNTGGQSGGFFVQSAGHLKAAASGAAGTNTGGNTAGSGISGGTAGAAIGGTTAIGGSGGVWEFAGDVGGAASGASGTNTGGTGSDIYVQAGYGGNATGGTTANGGAGGHLFFSIGEGGTGDTAAGVDGSLVIQSIPSGTVHAQFTTLGQLGVNTVLNSINAAAIFQLDSTTRGVLPPRMTTAQFAAISSKPEGLFAWNSTLHAITYYDGAAVQAVPTQAAVNAKASTATACVSLFSHFADVSNVTTGNTTLYTDALSAGQLATNGNAIEAEYELVTATTVSTKQVRLYFGPLGTASDTLIFDSTALAITANGVINVWVKLVRVSASVVRAAVTANYSGTGVSVFAGTTYTEVTGLTLANAQSLTLTGTSSAASADITAKLAKAIFQP